MSTKQLYEKTSEGMKEVSPLVDIEDIYSKLSDTPLEALVSLYNHVKCEWKGSVADTRRTVPLFLRRSGLFITYNNGTKYITEFFSAGTDQITTEGWIKDSNWTPVPDEDYVSAGVKPGVGSIGYEQLNDNLKQLFREKVNVTNYPDDEDIASVDNMLKLKDREANTANFQSKGYVILRKNLRLINGVIKNILTQDMINKPNTIYEIRYDFDLNENSLEIPENCVLKFEGGSIRNGIISAFVIKTNKFSFDKTCKIYGKIYVNEEEYTTYGEKINRKFILVHSIGNSYLDSITRGIRDARKVSINDFAYLIYSYDLDNDTLELTKSIISTYKPYIHFIKIHPRVTSENIEKIKKQIELIISLAPMVKYITISNEDVEYCKTENGGKFLAEFARYLKTKYNRKIGISCNFNYKVIYPELKNELDAIGYNLYPQFPFSKDIQYIREIGEHCIDFDSGYYELRTAMQEKEIFITESGVDCFKESIMAPSMWNMYDCIKLHEDTNSDYTSLWYDCVLNNYRKLNIPLVTIWYGEQIYRYSSVGQLKLRNVFNKIR